MDTVRIIRILEYVGPRDKMEHQIAKSIHGERTYCGITIRAITLGTFPEIMERDSSPKEQADASDSPTVADTTSPSTEGG